MAPFDAHPGIPPDAIFTPHTPMTGLESPMSSAIACRTCDFVYDGRRRGPARAGGCAVANILTSEVGGVILWSHVVIR